VLDIARVCSGVGPFSITSLAAGLPPRVALYSPSWAARGNPSPFVSRQRVARPQYVGELAVVRALNRSSMPVISLMWL
jgi:hypothetical protein